MHRILLLLPAAALAFADDVVLPDGKAKTIVENNCVDCHGLDQVAQSQMSPADWKSTVNRMVKKGAGLAPAEIDLVADYLAANFPPDKMNINSATPGQLIAGLQLTAAEAAAVIQFRTANGNFKNLSDLAKVSGVDPKKIAAKKDQIVF